ncbi:MAG: DUF4143 domain-containing protein [Bacteroidales bacterium]|nr:DUF4143 domain-containing protein [Bacteroidales bacterium]MCF8339006.1 DUF4143 domain-containing protein [Bacteroidales bacterium]
MHRLGFNFSANKGRVLENIVFLELIRRNKEVYYHTGKYECDFVVKEGLKVTSAIQVAYSLHSQNYEREYRGLEEAMKTYEAPSGLVLVYEKDEDVPSKKGMETLGCLRYYKAPTARPAIAYGEAIGNVHQYNTKRPDSEASELLSASERNR